MNVKEPGLRPGAAAPPTLDDEVYAAAGAAQTPPMTAEELKRAVRLGRLRAGQATGEYELGYRDALAALSSQPTPTEGGPQ